MKKSILAILAIAATGSVMAQAQPYATIVSAQGLSTISVGDKLVNAVSGMTLAQGSKVLTTAKSEITIDFAGACTATVKSGQALNVNLADCKTLVAQQGSSKMNMGSGSAAGGIEAISAATAGMSTAGIAAAVAAAAVVTVGAVDAATRNARYVSVANGDGTFTVTDTKTKLKATVLANGTVVPLVAAAPAVAPADAAPAPAASGG